MNKNKSITLPSGEVVFGSETIIPDGHFNWNEATFNLKRIPSDISIEGNIYRIAHELEKMRTILGRKPIIIHSWYRDRFANSNLVNAASNSRHLHGDAVDFSCSHISLENAYIILDSWHQKGGLSLYKKHIHIDWRGKKARW